MPQYARISSGFPCELNPLFYESRLEALKIANRRFEAIRVDHSSVMKPFLFCESIRVNSRIAPIRIAI